MSSYFDIRAYVSNPDAADAKIQRAYNIINLSVCAFGEIKLADAYGLPFATILEKGNGNRGLIDGWSEAKDVALIAEDMWQKIDEAAKNALALMKKELPTTSMRELCEKDYAAQQPELFTAFKAMTSHGVCLPFVQQTADQKAKAMGVFAGGFLNPSNHPSSPGVGDLIEMDLFTREAAQYPKVHAAIQAAKGAGILGGPKGNDKCCTGGLTCTATMNKFCSIGLSGRCSLYSDPCSS